MRMIPKISIITPVYNAEKTLQHCIESVLAQNDQNIEWIFIDDGSIDRSGEICDTIAEKHEFIRVVHTPNRGVSAARNTGIELATGEYLFLLDSDDSIEKNTLLQYRDECGEQEYDVLVGGITFIDHDSGKKWSNKPEDFKELQFGIWEMLCYIPSIFGYAGGKLIRTAVVKENGIKFREDMHSQEDLEFFLSVYQVTNRIKMVNCIGYQYDYVPGKRFPITWDYIRNQIKLLGVAEKNTNLSAEARQQVIERIAGMLYVCLYDIRSKSEYNAVIEKLTAVEGMVPLLREVKSRREVRFVSQCFVKEKYRQIRMYFVVRNFIRDMVRKIRKRTKN